MESSMKLGNDVEGRRSKRRLHKINNLPDELLTLILSFLPTWYAARTSILSRRWRYLFKLTDCLSLDDELFKQRGAIPLSSWLPKLKILHLNSIKFGDDHHPIERLLSSCEFLEELTLDGCVLYTRGHVTMSLGHLKVLKLKQCPAVGNGFFEIEAPKLAYLTYYTPVDVKVVPLRKHSRSLVKAELHLSGNANDRDILRDVAYKTTELDLRSNAIQYLLMIGDTGKVHDFPWLSRIHFFYISYDSWKYVTSVLDKSPQLEIIVFTAGLHHCYRRLSASPPSEFLLPFSCHAKVIEVNHLCGHDRSSLLLLGHLLKNARELKKLIVRKCHGFDDMEEALQISKDLLTLPRASTDCCIRVFNFNHGTTL